MGTPKNKKLRLERETLAILKVRTQVRTGDSWTVGSNANCTDPPKTVVTCSGPATY